MAKTSDSPIARILTLYEHMETSDFGAPMEDEEYRYITVPAKDEERILKFFRIGYKPAPDHAGNGADVVILRHNKADYQAKYQAAADELKGFVRDISPATEKNKDVTVSSAVSSGERTLKELVDRLPDTDPDQADDQ